MRRMRPAVLVMVLLGVFVLSKTGAWAAAEPNLLSNARFTDDLSSWETTITESYAANGRVFHDRQAFGLGEGSLKVETTRGSNVRLEASATQEIKHLKAGSKVTLDLWWRKLITVTKKKAEMEISVWLLKEGGDPLLLWRDLTVPPVPETAMSGRITGLESDKALSSSGPYDLVVRIKMRSGAAITSLAAIQIDDVTLRAAQGKPTVFTQKPVSSRTVKANARAVPAMAFSLKSTAGEDLISKLDFKETRGAPLFSRARLFADSKPYGVVDAGDKELGRTAGRNGRFAFEGLTLRLHADEAHLLVAVDMKAGAAHGGTQTLTLSRFQGLYEQTEVDRRSVAKIAVDSRPPAPIANFVGFGGDNPFLSWENPADRDFVRFRVLRKKNSAPAGPFDAGADVVGEAKKPAGPLGAFVDQAPGMGKFFYAVYTSDRLGNYATDTLPGVNSGFVEVNRSKPVF